jgi:hypothetical protein
MTNDMMSETNTEVEQPVDETPALSIEDIEALLAAEMPDPEAPFPGDPDATWDYWSGLYNPTAGPSDEVVWARLRYRRDALLAECDWRVVADAPWDATPWVAYRQALRDLPDTTTDPRKAVWPVKP